MDAEATARKQKHVAEEYLSSLSDLQCNSKPLINMLTMLAEENIDYAPIIVKVVEQHIAKVPTDLKLPLLYLIDSIVKNVQNSYVALFGQCIVNIFCGVFEKVNEKVRERMYALRQTWNEVFPASKLYQLDVRVKQMDKNWPITAVKQQPTAIHVNPNFLKSVPNEMEELLQAKTRELLELKKRKLELELEATKKHIEEQQKQLAKSSESGVVPLLDPHIDPSILASTSTQMPQNLPTPSVPTTHVNPVILTGQAQNAASAGSTYNQNYVRPTSRAGLQSQKGPMQVVRQVHPGMAAQNNIHKVKVHPVNPALLNTIRNRDPRLLRQQLQQQKPLIHQGDVPPTVPENTLGEINPSTTLTAEELKRDRRGGPKSSKSNRYNSGNESSKLSTHQHSTKSGSSQRSSKSSSSSSSTRSKDREQKRSNETKTYSKSSDRRYSKTSSTTSNSSSKNSNTSKTDIDSSETFVPTSLGSGKSNKSPDSQTKFKDSSKRLQAGKTIPNSSKNGLVRRSKSPDDIVSSAKDVDLRGLSTTDSIGSDIKTHAVTSLESIKKAAVKDLEQNNKKDLEPVVIVASSSMGIKPPIIQDVDLRQLLPGTIVPTISQSTTITRTTTTTSLNVPIISLKNVVPVEIVKTPIAALDRSANSNLGINVDRNSSVIDASSSSTKSPTPKVSFKIQKSFNKLAKSTETLSTASTTKTSRKPTEIMGMELTSLSSSSSSSTQSPATAIALAKNDSESVSSKKSAKMDVDVEEEIGSRSVVIDGKKRMSETGVSDEPIAKKSKSTKMDALFGSEDVDLRTLPPPIITKAITNDVLAPPPPPNISPSDDDQQQEVNKNRDSKVSKISTQNTASQKLPSNFEDVRAKFAKATRLSKLDKANDKKRPKFSEVNINDDDTTQEAQDEKIRIILSQAQEMLESNSLNQGQYKQLVQTVMSLNEKNKLEEAKRRESLQQQSAIKVLKDPTASPKDEDCTASTSAELMAARDAVLRKRIPKIPKTNASNTSNDVIEQNMREGESPVAGENADSHDGGAAGLNKLKPKEKRVRHSKWNDRNESQANMNSNLGGPAQQRNWIGGPGGKRRNSGMRTGNVPPPPQAPQTPMILGPNSLHQMQGNIWTQTGNQNNRSMPFGNQMSLMRTSVPPPPQPPSMSIPPVLPALTPNGLPKPCNSIDNPQAELVRTITIDGQSKDIRIYDDVAIVFMELDEPREIGFQPGQRAIIIDNQDPVTLRFNDDYMPLMIAGEQHRVRFGFPSRELYIDEHWYEIYFGGPPVSIPINNRIHILKAEGPPPQVNIGLLRHDLVVGKIHMIVEAVNLFPLFLDARVQVFRLDDREHTVQFADNLLTVLLDGQPAHVEYGGLPKSYNLSGKRYFIRFTTLPKGVVAGKVEIKDMIYVKSEPLKKIELPLIGFANADKPGNMDVIQEEKNDGDTVSNVDDIKSDATPHVASTLPIAPTTALGKINIDELFQKLVSSGILNNNAATTVDTPVAALDTNVAKSDSSPEAKVEKNISEKEEENLPPIVPIDLRKSELIKTRQNAIISTLYSGMQCSSCGVRFPPEQTIKYSQHLDWHFRQNRRERDSTRRAHSRKWYYELNDWLQYEEIEDLEEREKNFFEAQQNDLDAIDDMSNQRSTNSPLPSCPAGPEDVDRVCDMCQEKFEQFYNEELEEWHLRAALRVEDKIYHPLCYEDYKASLNPQPLSENDTQAKSIGQDVVMQEDDNAVDVVIKIEEDEKGNDGVPSKSNVVIEDEDDDVIVLPNEEPSVTEIVDDDEEEYVPAHVTREDMKCSFKDNARTENKDESAMESDVEIQEPHIPFTDLDTYEEKELPIDENSQTSFLNVKIKDEPKDDEDEDDGFEDVGTVVYGPHDEISLQSSEETQTQTIISSTDSPLTVVAEHSSSANTFNPIQPDEPSVVQTSGEVEDTATISEESNLISIDGNLEPADGHNLSSTGSAIPLGSLVHRIKINITKNTSVATTHTTPGPSVPTIATTSAAASAVTSTSTSVIESATTSSLNSNSNNSSTKPCNLNTSTNVVSTIPVLCAGGRIPSSNINVSNNSNVNYITVIGSYGNYHKPQQHHHHHHQQSVPVLSTPVCNTVAMGTSDNTTITTANVTNTRQRTPSPPMPTPPPALTPISVEETPTYELKPALQKANLKEMKKIKSGIETSGLCSIM